MKAAPHILFVCSWYPTKEAPALGNFIQMHARAAALHYRVSVIYAHATDDLEAGNSVIKSRTTGSLDEFIVEYGKEKSSLPIVGKLKKRNAYIANMGEAAAKAVKKNGNPDLIHVHVIWPAALSALKLIKTYNAPLIISEHWSGYLAEDGNYKGVIQKNFSRQLADKTKLITVVSGRMESAMRQHQLGNKFIRLSNAIDVNIFNYKGRTNDSTIKFLHVSMLVDREKNVSGLLHGFSKIKTSNCELHIIGSGNDEYELRAKKPKNVFFHGFMSAEQIAEQMNQCNALVMFSNFEGMPVTIIEAQCCGMPVIATKVGAIPEMIQDDNGVLVDVKDEDGLTSAMDGFVQNANRYDRSRISETAKNKYSLEAVGEELRSIYSAVLSDGK